MDIFEDISSPEVNNQNLGRPLTCWYRFRTLKGAPRDFVLRLRFKKFKVGQLLNATHCEGGYLQVSRVGRRDTPLPLWCLLIYGSVAIKSNL